MNSPAQCDVLDVDRLVEPVLGVEPRRVACGKPLLTVPRPAGDGVHQEEGDDRDREQDRNDPEEAPADIAITVSLLSRLLRTVVVPGGPAFEAGPPVLVAEGDSVLQDLDGLVELVTRQLRVARGDRSDHRRTAGPRRRAAEAQRQDAPRRSTGSSEPDCRGLPACPGPAPRRLGHERVEVRVAVLDVVVAAAAQEQTELVVRVRVVGTPAVTGDMYSPAVRCWRKTLKSLPI